MRFVDTQPDTTDALKYFSCGLPPSQNKMKRAVKCSLPFPLSMPKVKRAAKRIKILSV